MLYECKNCNYDTKYKTHFTDHLKSKRHLKKTIEAEIKKVKSTESTESTNKDSVDFKEENLQKIDANITKNISSSQTLSSNVPLKSKDKKNGEYICCYCNIKFISKSNLIRHEYKCNLKNNHIRIDEDKSKNLICPICNIQCSLKRLYTRHINICIEKKNKINFDNNIEIIKLNYEKKISDEKLKASEKLVEVLQEQNKNNNNLAVGNMCNVNGMIESNMRTMTFLNKFMNNTPPLEYFDKEFEDPYEFYIDYDKHKKLKETSKLENTKNNILYFDEDKMTKDEYIIDHILYLQETKQTVKFIVDRLIHFYKKEGDDIKQSIWNIDMYRYNFTVCLKTGNKTIWHSDKQGQITTEMLLDPLLEFTSKILEKQLEIYKNELSELAKDKNTNDMLKVLKKIEYLTDFTLSVKNKNLQLEIIKKLSPLLFFDISKYRDKFDKEILELE